MGRHHGNTVDFIEKAKSVHGDTYSYSNVDYVNSRTKIQIICNAHGIFKQTPNIHLLGAGCPICANDLKRLTHSDFVIKARMLHCDRYEYYNTIYKSSKEKIAITCRKHGDFKQTPNDHLSKKLHGCPKCKIDINRTAKLSNSYDFILKANKVHMNEYDYSLVEYKSSKKNVTIICREHGEFRQTPNSHLMGKGCSKCHGMNRNTEEIIKDFNKVHNNRYDYSKVNYVNIVTKVEIICKLHGSFMQRPSAHIHGKTGCPLCRLSHGELAIYNKLKNMKIEFKSQFTDSRCFDIRKLKFDFALIENNKTLGLIEYNGVQHYEDTFRNTDDFVGVVRRDEIKIKFCEEHNIPLLVIKYTEYDNISELIDAFVVDITKAN